MGDRDGWREGVAGEVFIVVFMHGEGVEQLLIETNALLLLMFGSRLWRILWVEMMKQCMSIATYDGVTSAC